MNFIHFLILLIILLKMKIFSFTLNSVFISFMIFYLGTVTAADAKNDNAPKLEYFGSLTYRDIGEVKNFSRNFVANLGSGTLTLSGTNTYSGSTTSRMMPFAGISLLSAGRSGVCIGSMLKTAGNFSILARIHVKKMMFQRSTQALSNN